MGISTLLKTGGRISVVAFLVAFSANVFAQTNPTPFDLSSGSFTFTSQTGTNTTYPANMQGWGTSANNITTAETAAPASDLTMVASGTNTTSGLSNLGANGFQFISTGTAPNRRVGEIAVALNTVGRSSIQVTWTAEDRQAGANYFSMGLALQYRIGTVGTFTTVSGTTYTSSASAQATAQTFSNIALPAECEGHSIVQVRWIYYQVGASGASGRDPIRLDDITISSSAASCSNLTLPVTQGFNVASNTAANQSCWNQQYVTGGLPIRQVTAPAGTGPTGFTPQQGTGMVFYNSYSNSTSTRLVTPPITTTGTASVDVEFQWYQTNTSSSYTTEGVTVQWSTDGTTWNDFTGNFIRQYNATTGWKLITLTLPSGAGNVATLYVGFRFTGAAGYDCYMDAVDIHATPVCGSQPTSLLSSSVAATTATISWTAATLPPANGYEYYLSTSSTAPTSGTTPTGSTAAGVVSVNLTGLSAATPYYFWVRSNCNGTDKSGWAGSATFTTLLANDACADATALPCGTNALAGTTVGTVLETAPISVLSGYGVWYTFVGDGLPTTIFTTAGSGYDHELLIMSGTTCGAAYTQIASKDGATSGGTETHTFTSVNGTKYYVYIAHYSTTGTSTNTGTFTISRTCTSLSGTTVTAFGNQCINTNGGPNSFTVTGSGLSGNVTVTAPTGFTVSSSAGGTYASTLTLTPSSGNLSAVPVFVRFTPPSAIAYSANITLTGGGATTVNVAVSGTGINTTPTATTSSYSSLTYNSVDIAGSFDNSAGCTAVSSYGIEYSTTSGFACGSGTSVASTNQVSGSFTSLLTGLNGNTPYYYRAYAVNGGGRVCGAEQTFTTPNGAALSAGALTGFGSVCINTTTGPNSFTVTSSALSGDVTVTAPSTAYTFSTSPTGPFSAPLTLTMSGGTVPSPVYVQFTPTTATSFNGNITLSGGGASTVNVAATGSGINTAATSTTGSASGLSAGGATIAGSYTLGCQTLSSYGIEYSTTNGFAGGTGTAVPSTNQVSGSYTSVISGLSANTVYYFRSYVITAAGSVYGNQGSFTTLPNCATLSTPASASTNICPFGTVLTWSAPAGGATAYKLYVGTDGSGSTYPTNLINGTNVGAVTTYTIPSVLAANTTYRWVAVPTNAGGDATTCTVFTFTTQNISAVGQTPVTQNFESTCIDWTIVNGTQTNKWVVGSATNNGGSKSIYISNDNGVSNAYTISSNASVVQFYKDVTIPAGQTLINLSFDWKANGEGCCDYLRVFDAPTSITPVAGTQTSTTYQVGASYNLTTAYATVNLTLPAADAGTTRRIIFEWRNDGSAGLQTPAAIDNISITSQVPPPPSCATLTTPANNTNNLCVTGTNLNWTAPASGTTPTGYKLFYGTDNPPTNIVNGTNLGNVLTYATGALSANTDYYWQVVPTAASGDATGCTIYKFTTGAAFTPATTTPIAQDFEYCNDWTIVNGSQTNKWVVGNATNNGGSKSIYISNDNGVSNAYTTGSTSVTQFYKDIAIPAGQTIINLSFDWKANGESCCDYLRVFDAPTSVTPTAGTQTSTTYQIGASYNLGSSFATVNLTLPAADAGTTRRIIFEWRNDGGVGSQTPAAVDNINLTSVAPSPMAINTITATQQTGNIYAGISNNNILQVNVNTTGTLGGLTLSTLKVTSANTNDADFGTIKLWSGTVSGPVTTLATGVFSSGAVNFNGIGSALVTGNNYYWITYDVNSSATSGNLGDAVINIGDITFTATSPSTAPTGQPVSTLNPAGNRPIVGKLCGVYTINKSIPTGLNAGVYNYSSFTEAVTDLNNVGINCSTVFKVKDGQTFQEKVPALVSIPGVTSTKTVTFQRDSTGASRPVLQGTTGVGSIDGVIQLNSTDYLTWDGIDLANNPANATANTKMEYGIFLNGASTDGCQNNVFKNANVSLNITSPSNSNVRGARIYSTATNASGANSNNKFYNLQISNVVWGYSFEGASAGYDNNNEINALAGGTSSITNFGSTSNSASYGVIVSYQTNFKVQNTTISNPTGSSVADIYGVYASAGANNTLDISYNTITDFSAFTSGVISGIYVPTGNSASSTIAYNTIKTFSGGSDTYVSYGIYASNLATITNNIIGGSGANAISMSGWAGFHAIAYGGTSSGVTISNNRIDSITCTDVDAQLIGILVSSLSSSASNVTIANNSIQQLVNYGFSDVYGIFTASTSTNITNNIVDAIIQTGTENGYVTGIEADGGTTTIQGNTVTNLLANGTGTDQSMYGIYSSGVGNTISNNRISGISNTYASSTANMYGIRTAAGTNTATFDTVTNLSLAGSGFVAGISMANGSAAVNNNIVNTVSNTGTGLAYGVKMDGNNCNVNTNTISGITAAAANVYGIYGGGNNATISINKVSGITVSGGSSTAVRGISVLGTGTNTVYKNVINSVVHNGTTGALAVGIQANSTSTSTNIVNNMISNVTANSSNNGTADAVRGISLEGTNVVKLYYNTVNLTGTATNASFECAALHTTTSVSLDSRNNILSNNYGGTGKKAAIYCTTSDATYNTNLNAASNNNLLYAGTPGASNVILRVNTGGDKQTIANYTSYLSTKETAAFTLASVPFVSATDLHIDVNSAALCGLHNKGVSVTTPLAISDDIDADVRGTTPDVGADEWNLPNPVAGTATASANPSCAGSSISIDLTGHSTGADFTYVWQRDNGSGFVDIDTTVNTADGGVYSNFTTSSLSIADVAGKTGYKYQCVVSRCSPAVATATSNAVTLSVSTASTAPSAINGTTGICVGGNTTLTATGGTVGTGSVYEWGTGLTVGSNILAGQTAATLSVTPATTTNYWVRRKDPAPCSTTTGAATTTVTVNAAPTASAGSNASISNALTYTLTGNATNYSSYTWSHSGAGTLSNTNTLSPTYDPATGETGNVTITLTVNALAGCTNTSSSMVLTVTAAPVITWVGNTVDWSVATNWTPATVPNSCNANVIIPTAPTGGNYPEVNSAHSVGNLQVQNGARITLNNKINVCGNFTGGNSATNVPVILGNSYLEFNGSTSQTLSGRAIFQTLRLNNATGAQLAANASFDVFVALELQNGNLNIPASATLRFRSTSSTQVAVIDDYSFLPASHGSITGNIKAERYYDAPSANSYNQHFMSSPVNAPALSQFGASGSAGYVINTDCSELQSNSNSPYGNVFQYDETNGTNCGFEAWKVLTNGNAENGKGYSVAKTGAGKLTLTGEANLDPVYLLGDLTNSGWANITAQGRPLASGWYLMGNPYLADLNLQTDLGPGVDAQVQIWNALTGQFEPYVVGVDPVVPIAPFQAFMVHKTTVGGTAPAVINGSDRTRSISTSFFQQNNPEELTIVATNNQNNSVDKTRVRFMLDATAQFDADFDANKMSGLLENHNVYTLNNGVRMSRNNLHSITETSTVPLSMYVGTGGSFTFTFDGIQSFDPTSYIFLEDVVTGTWTNLRSVSNYTFSMNQGDNTDRFVLHFTPAAIVNTTPATCQKKGTLYLEQPGTANWNYVINDQNGAPVNFGVLNNANATVLAVNAGTYTITLTDNNGYTVVKNVTVNGASTIAASFTASSTTVETGEVISLNSTTANAVTTNWEFSDGTVITGVQNPTYSFTAPGVYTVTLTVTNADGCESSLVQTITVNETVATGINNVAQTAVNIFSFSNSVVVDFGDAKLVNAQVDIYNTLGQRISSEKTENRVYSKPVNNSEAAYVIVRVLNDDKVTMKKVFVTNR